MIYRLGDKGPEIAGFEQDLTKAGLGPVAKGMEDDLDPTTFDAGMKKRVELFQAAHHDERGRPLSRDGIIGPATAWALKHQDLARGLITPPAGTIKLPMMAVKMPHYSDWVRTGRLHTFWLHADVAESFVKGIAEWEAAGNGRYVVTETYRTVERQAAAKKAKPSLCVAPGWSLHGHGRAVDGWPADKTPAGLRRFYAHMQRFGWYTIFNFPGEEVEYQSREAWHIQNTSDSVMGTESGLPSRTYLKAWAKRNGGVATLTKVVRGEA